MVSKRLDSGVERALEPLDEGWWAAVLADEDYQPVGTRDNTARQSKHPMLELVDWEHVQALFEHDEIVSMHVEGYNRGGLLVEGEKLQGFVPVSHLVDMPNGVDEEERRRVLSGYVGRNLELKVIECEPDQDRVVFSERAALAGEGCRKKLFSTLHSGEHVHGIVTNVTEFGVFVDLGGLEGLIHVSELSWGRVQHPGDILQVGQEVDALVLQVSEENARVALSVKRLMDNPWDTISSRYSAGDIVIANITSIVRFGAFAKLEEGVEGLIHISSMNLPPNETNLHNFLWHGQSVKVQILHIEAVKRRLGLGLVSCE